MDSKSLMQHPYLDEVPVVEETPDPGSDAAGSSTRRLDWRQLLGGLSVVAGLVTLVGGWFGMSGTTQLSAQLAYMFSGGFGGAALIALGATFFVAFEHHADRLAIQALDMKLAELQASVQRVATQPAGRTVSEPRGASE
jgi:hypothetical protein